MERQLLNQRQQQLNMYRQRQVKDASPAELLLLIYDFAVASCAAQDKDRAVRCFSELIDALNFEYAQVADGLLQLHRYCLEQVHKGDFVEAHKVARELRDAWRTALRQLAKTGQVAARRRWCLSPPLLAQQSLAKNTQAIGDV